MKNAADLRSRAEDCIWVWLQCTYMNAYTNYRDFVCKYKWLWWDSSFNLALNYSEYCLVFWVWMDCNAVLTQFLARLLRKAGKAI